MATALRHDLEATMQELGESARAAARTLATVPREAKDRALLAGAERLRADSAAILEANARDLGAARERGAADVPARSPGAGCGAHRGDGGRSRGGRSARRSDRPGDGALATAERPRHRARARAARRVGIIYESRPNVTADAGALCLKAGNAAILRGGSESFHSSRAILACLQDGTARRQACRQARSSACRPPIAPRSACC